MGRFSGILCLWLREKCGSTAIEYSLIAAGIAMAIAATVYILGDTVLIELYSDLATIIQ